MVALEVFDPKGFGRVRMQRIPDVRSESLFLFICNVVAHGSTVVTDSWSGYNGLEQLGYVHNKINISDSGDPAHVNLPGVHRVASLLKRWLLGTYQGGVRAEHLDYYLDEYTFRFNRRDVKITWTFVLSVIESSCCVALCHTRKLSAKNLSAGRDVR